MATPKAICNSCHKKVLTHAKVIKCSLCNLLTHTKCLPNYTDTDIDYATDPINSWSCPTCLASIFPFTNIDDSPDFLNTISTPLNHLIDVSILDNMIFDPFLPLDENGEGELGDVDPDENYLTDIRGSLLQNCKYYYNTKLYDETKLKSELVDLTLCHLNIRSLSKNMDSFLTTLYASNLHFDLMAFTETWLTTSNVDAHGIPGYTHEYIIRENRAGGGTSLFLNEKWNYKIRNDLTVNTNDI
jgi:hypothetical protein